MTFGSYSPERAERIKDRLDSELGKIEARVQYLKQVVPDTAAACTRLDGLVEDAREIVEDLHLIVDRRTDPEAVA
jgi:hypothetical protein